jgi:hypothetical protein
LNGSALWYRKLIREEHKMGIRGELYSTTVGLQNRTYFFNVKENRMGDLYLNIVESKNKETGGFDRQSVILFADDLSEFLKGFEDSLRVLEKAVKEKRRNAARPKTGTTASAGDNRDGGEKKRYTGKSAGGKAENGGRGAARKSGGKPRKVVVRKRDRDG